MHLHPAGEPNKLFKCGASTRLFLHGFDVELNMKGAFERWKHHSCGPAAWAELQTAASACDPVGRRGVSRARRRVSWQLCRAGRENWLRHSAKNASSGLCLFNELTCSCWQR